MIAGSGQQLHRGNGGVLRIVEARLAVLMPDGKHAAHRDVDLALAGLIVVFAEGQQRKEHRVDLNGLLRGALVERADADDALFVVGVVGVKELMQVQICLMDGIRPGVECLLTLRVGNELNDGVKGIHIDGAVLVHLRARGRQSAQGESEQQRGGSQFFHDDADLLRV